MKNSNQIQITVKSICHILFFSLLFTSFQTQAQNTTTIQNRWKSTFISQTSNRLVLAGSANTASQRWVIEAVPGTNFIRIKNKSNNQYLHVQNGPLELGTMQPNWWSAMWALESAGTGYVRIKNRWKSNYIHNQNGQLEVGTIQDGWWSAMWKLAEFNTETIKYNGKSVITFKGQSKQGGDCSLPDFILKVPSMKKFAEKHFLPACEMHDHIYNKVPFTKAGITNGKEIADNIFYEDMLTICRNGNFDKFGEKFYCERVAASWYFLVTNAQEGHTAYTSGQAKAEKSVVISKDLIYAKTIKKTGIYGDNPLLGGGGVKSITRWMFGTNNTLKTANTTNNISYDLTFETGSMKGAGTDANVKIELIGERGRTIPVELNSFMGSRLHNAFQVAGQDKITLITTDIGKITGVKVSHDNGGFGADWYLSALKIKTTRKTYSFLNNAWIKKNDVKTLYPTPDLRDYDIKVKTGDKGGAGTSANVYLTLYGTTGQSEEIRLNGYIDGDAFESEDLDEITLRNVKDIGRVNKVKIRHDNANYRPAWYLVSVQVGSKVFTCNDWLESGKLSKELR